jgi:DNA-binding NarL/FixJ family response regulator
MDSIRIYLIDDHFKVLTQIEERLTQENDLNIVGKAVDVREATENIVSVDPDILLIDPVTTKGLDVEMIRNFREELPNASIVVLTAFVDTALLVELRKLGVCQILEKGIASQRLVDVLRVVGAGKN